MKDKIRDYLINELYENLKPAQILYTYDFNENENNLIEAGKIAMQEGELKGRFTMWDILMPKQDFDKI